MKKLTLPLISVLMFSGCASKIIEDTDPSVQHFDPDNDVIEVPDGQAEPTEPNVILAEKNRVSVSAHKIETIEDEDTGIEKENWLIIYGNNSLYPKCVGVMWKLLDFNFETNYPTDVYMKSKSWLPIGNMIQGTWNLDGIQFAPEPSGYVAAIRVQDPVEGAKEGEECTFVEDDKNVIEE
jgi:hypothetical protein